jgi:E3 ubiquitin-protein ligase MARCH6
VSEMAGDDIHDLLRGAHDEMSQEPDTCRICRGEATPDEPLFHSCKCSGSIKHVHQDW